MNGSSLHCISRDLADRIISRPAQQLGRFWCEADIRCWATPVGRVANDPEQALTRPRVKPRRMRDFVSED
jgi:hypothetical protein